MMDNGQLNFKNISNIFKGKKATVILLIIGFAGMALIFLSDFIHPGSDTSQNASQNASQVTVQSSDVNVFESQTESRLENIIGQIYGVGRVTVMVTAESGVENVYEQDNKTTTDTTQQNTGDGSTQTQESDDTEQDPIIINNDSGGQQAIIKVQRLPQILGVVVVCDGGDNPDVQECVVDTVSTVLGLPTNEIVVNRMKAESQ